jgi:hypothetical protein
MPLRGRRSLGERSIDGSTPNEQRVGRAKVRVDGHILSP